MAYDRWNHPGITFQSQRSDFRSGPLHLIRHHVPADVECGLDVTVPHELLLHSDGSPHSVQPRAVRVPGSCASLAARSRPLWLLLAEPSNIPCMNMGAVRASPEKGRSNRPHPGTPSAVSRQTEPRADLDRGALPCASPPSSRNRGADSQFRVQR